MPSNIVLRDLTTPPVKGNISPLLSTVAAERDGTRDTGGSGGGDPLPQPDQVDARWNDPIYQPIFPGGIGSGTNDSAFTFDKFEYLGSFAVGGEIVPEQTDKDANCMCYVPPNGTNGVNGSVMVGYHPYNNGNNAIIEYEIPSISPTGEDYNTLPVASRIQNVTVYDKLAESQGHSRIGFLKVIDGKLFINNYNDYSPSSNPNLIIVDSVVDLDNATWRGYINLSDGSGGDRMAHYCFRVPESRKASFGSHSYMAGNFLGMSMIPRASFGPSMYGWNPESMAADQTVINATPYAYYTPESPLENFSISNSDVSVYYDNAIGLDWMSWTRIPDTATTPPGDDSIVGDVLVDLYLYDGKYSAASPNYGVYNNTIVVKSQDLSVTFTEGVDYRVYTYNYEAARYGYDYKGAGGRAIVEVLSGSEINTAEKIAISYTYRKNRPYDLNYIPPPDRSIVKDTGTQDGDGHRAGFGMFIPNTDTIMFIGRTSGTRYGLKYKFSTIQDPFGFDQGFEPVDTRDRDDYYWLMNVNDVLSASSPTSVPIYKYGIFDNNRWASDGRFGNILSGDYDPITKKLYLLRTDMRSLVSQFTSRQIVSVYKLNF